MIKSHIDDKIREKYFKGRKFMVNPYKPGAGTSPEFLAGRDNLLDSATDILNELCEGGLSSHTIYYGVRGVGKTVLLNKVEEMAENLDYFYSHIECSDGFDFIKTISIQSKQFIKQLSLKPSIEEFLNKAKATLLSFKTTYCPTDNSFSFGLDEDIINKYGNADTGDFTQDLITLFTSLGNLAKSCNSQICFFIDEIQSIKKDYLISLIAAIHRMNQLNLPILIFGAGLPTILRISGDAKSYSERLFNFVEITSLKDLDAKDALLEPAKKYNIDFESDAVDFILKHTGCYPYFIQQYGRIVWKLVNDKTTIITKEMAEIAYDEYVEKLDESFFGVRFNRSTNAEKDFLYAMVKCKKFPCSMSELAKSMRKTPKSISPLRNNLINKGLIYAPSFGEIDFTVPHFDLFLNRIVKKEES